MLYAISERPPGATGVVSSNSIIAKSGGKLPKLLITKGPRVTGPLLLTCDLLEDDVDDRDEDTSHRGGRPGGGGKEPAPIFQ